MRIIICEDDDAKLMEIAAFIRDQGVPDKDVVAARTLVEFFSLADEGVDLCIIDIRIPAYEGAKAEQNGIAILQRLVYLAGTGVKLLAISAYPEEFSEIRPKFEAGGCILADYHDKNLWRGALKTLLLQSASKVRFDFLVFVALEKERAPYAEIIDTEGVPHTTEGISRFDFEINGRSGSVVLLPRMGLVDAAITASRCIQLYSPRIVGMSGICGGFEQNAELGQLLISEAAYEYQSGKWSTDGFTSEPYQVPISEPLRALVAHLVGDAGFCSELENGWRGERPRTMSKPKLGPFTSGSAVIASAELMAQVAKWHRKVAGLDMEVYSIHRAAHLASCRPDVLCAKVVVDLANKEKDDRLHDYGSYVSAKFMIATLQEYFSGK